MPSKFSCGPWEPLSLGPALCLSEGRTARVEGMLGAHSCETEALWWHQLEWKRIETREGTVSHQVSGLLPSGWSLLMPKPGTQFVTIILSLPFLLRSLRCGLVLWTIRTSWSCSSVASSESPCSILLPSSLETLPWLWHYCPAFQIIPLVHLPPALPIWNSSLPPHHFRVGAATGLEKLDLSNHEDHETTALASVWLDIPSKAVLQVDKLGWRVSVCGPRSLLPGQYVAIW